MSACSNERGEERSRMYQNRCTRVFSRLFFCPTIQGGSFSSGTSAFAEITANVCLPKQVTARRLRKHQSRVAMVVRAQHQKTRPLLLPRLE
jgi:hypothetical protein